MKNVVNGPCSLAVFDLDPPPFPHPLSPPFTMFKHKAQTKPSSNLKGSARRALLASICSSFSLDESTLTPEAKQALLPKDIRHARAVTHSDRSKLLIYSDEEGKPLWIKFESGPFDKILLPTVITLWKNPYLANDRSLNTPINVLPVIQGGADLMIPGCFPPYPSLIRGQAVVYLSYPERIPLGVGVVLVDQTRTLSRDMKGKAAQTIHTIGDTLVAQFKNDNIITPDLQFDYTVPRISDVQEPSEPIEQLAAAVENLSTDEPSSTTEQVPTTEESIETNEPTETTETPAPEEIKDDDSSDDEGFTPGEADDLFQSAVLLSIHQYRNPDATTNTNPNLSSALSLPISASQFLDTFVTPNLAISSPKLTIKATSHKKATKFFKSMEKLGALTTKEMKDGMYVMEVANTDSKAFEDFEPYTIRKKKKPASTDGSSALASNSNSGKGNQMIAVELWKPHSASSPFFNSVARQEPEKFAVQQYYDAEELKARLVTYINSKSLISKKDKRNVIVDEVLIQAFGLNKPSKSANPVSYFPGSSVVGRDKIVSLLESQCTAFHLLYSPNDLVLQQFSEATAANKGVVPTSLLLRVLKPAKGGIPKININTERRGGNKTVTTITGLESFGIVPAAFAEELRKVCAGSTSVNSVKPGGGSGGGSKGGKGKNTVEPKDEAKDDGPKQVLIQGPQIKSVEAALLKKGIRPGWINITDKVGGGKKAKK